MKTIKFLSMMATAALLVTSCSDDDDAGPEEVNEEEVITTMTVTLTPTGGGSAVVLQSQDLDGDGPNAPEITVSGNLVAESTYEGEIELLNETETPAEDVTEEVEEEGDEHQFIFEATGSIETIEYDDVDANGNPVGIEFTLTTGAAGNATLAITLRHEPTKPNDGTLAGAGGETDITQTFAVTVE